MLNVVTSRARILRRVSARKARSTPAGILRLLRRILGAVSVKNRPSRKSARRRWWRAPRSAANSAAAILPVRGRNGVSEGSPYRVNWARVLRSTESNDLAAFTKSCLACSAALPSESPCRILCVKNWQMRSASEFGSLPPPTYDRVVLVKNPYLAYSKETLHHERPGSALYAR